MYTILFILVPYAKTDIISNKNTVVYALQGEPIEIVNRDHGEVLICKNKHGTLFPAHQSKLSDLPPLSVKQEKEQVKKPAVKQSRKAKSRAELLQLEYLKK